MGKFATGFKSINLTALRKPRRVKWGNNDDETLCSWVADMDFGIPPAVKSAMEEMVRDEEFGYPFWDLDPVIVAFENRMKRRYNWAPISERTKVLSDLIQILQIVLHHSTRPGDGIAIHVLWCMRGEPNRVIWAKLLTISFLPLAPHHWI